jgi:hypothetical protein
VTRFFLTLDEASIAVRTQTRTRRHRRLTFESLKLTAGSPVEQRPFRAAKKRGMRGL